MGPRRTSISLLPLLLCAVAAGPFVARAQETSLVDRALANEMAAAQNHSHPMRYRLRKSSPRLTTTKDLIETKDGGVARLIAVNDGPLNPADAEKEASRLDALLADPGKQRHRKQSQEADTARALDVLRVLPRAFLYQYAGPVTDGSIKAEKFLFSPNPKFDPPDLQTQVLTALAGEMWIDPEHARVVHLEGRLQDDVDFGWGILGRLSKGGWIAIDQAEVSPDEWRVVRFQMDMNARVLFRTRNFQTTEVESQFTPVPIGLTYRQGIELLRTGDASITSGH